MTATHSSFDSSGLQFAWDSTSLGWAQDCLRKYYYSMIERWRPQRKSPHLLFGGWYATALEHYHKYVAEDMSHDDAMREVVREALINTWEFEREEVEPAEYEKEALLSGRTVYEVDQVTGKVYKLTGGQPWEADHDYKNRGNLIRTIIWYLDQFKDDQAKVIHLKDGKPAVEYSFTFELTPSIIYCGHIDRLVEYSGDIFVQDQKTTKYQLTPKWFSQYHHPETQMGGYTFAGKIIYNKPIKGVIIDGAQIAVGFSRFERGFTYRTPDQLDEWRNNAMYHITQARREPDIRNFPMNPSSCDKYGGCPFKEVCSKPAGMRPQFLKADFYQGEQWNPLERR